MTRNHVLTVLMVLLTGAAVVSSFMVRVLAAIGLWQESMDAAMVSIVLLASAGFLVITLSAGVGDDE